MLCDTVAVTSLYFILQHFATVERFQWQVCIKICLMFCSRGNFIQKKGEETDNVIGRQVGGKVSHNDLHVLQH